MITDFDKVYLRSVYLVLNHMQNRVKNYDIDTILDILEIILEEENEKFREWEKEEYKKEYELITHSTQRFITKKEYKLLEELMKDENR